jgi:hypothetical protein
MILTGNANHHLGQKPPARTFIEKDFEYVDAETKRLLTSKDFELYKSCYIGQPVPQQIHSDKELRKIGYNSAEPWIQYCLESPIPNWG